MCNGLIAGPRVLLGARPHRDELDIAATQGLWPQWQQQNWLPVATDGSGNAYVVRGDQDDEAVYFVDCSADPGVLDYVVASSFVSFLKFLLEKELGTSGWPFEEAFVARRDPQIAAVIAAPLPWRTAPDIYEAVRAVIRELNTSDDADQADRLQRVMLAGLTPTEVLMRVDWTIGRILQEEPDLPGQLPTSLARLHSELDTLLHRS